MFIEGEKDMSCSLNKHKITMLIYFAEYSFRRINEPKLHCYILKNKYDF